MHPWYEIPLQEAHELALGKLFWRVVLPAYARHCVESYGSEGCPVFLNAGDFFLHASRRYRFGWGS